MSHEVASMEFSAASRTHDVEQRWTYTIEHSWTKGSDGAPTKETRMRIRWDGPEGHRVLLPLLTAEEIKLAQDEAGCRAIAIAHLKEKEFPVDAF